jgi:hypothetical protein
MKKEHLDRDGIRKLMMGFAPACVMGAAAELDLFTLLDGQKMTAGKISEALKADERAIQILLDALSAQGFLEKESETYSLPPSLAPLLTQNSESSFLPMIRHNMVMLRGWSQLAQISQSGQPARKEVSILGEEGDRTSFIQAMHSVSGPMAPGVVDGIEGLSGTSILDVGGASGSWTMALLSRLPQAKATIFDLPDAIELARKRVGKTPFKERISFASGDFYKDDLPEGHDIAWVSAIIHQHGRKENRDLFVKVLAALNPGGVIYIRDMVMEEDRINPIAGALFAVNMLVHTNSGGTFTFNEIREDLLAAGFEKPTYKVRSNEMNGIVCAVKPHS